MFFLKETRGTLIGEEVSPEESEVGLAVAAIASVSAAE